MRHEHKAEHVVKMPSGSMVAVCDCGATSVSDRWTKPGQESWHTCSLCTHAYGMGEKKP